MWNYKIKLALRHLWKDKVFTGINILGLALGIAVSTAIFLYANYHYSYDRFHEDPEEIYRVLTVDKALGVSSSRVGICPPAAGPAALNIPGVKAQTRYLSQGQNLLRVGERSIYAESFAFVDSNFFEFFNFPLKYGNASQVLRSPNQVILSAKLATKLFGQENPVGKTIQTSNAPDPVIVEGVFEDLPENSHIQFEMALSLVPNPGDTNTAQFLSTWQSIAAPTYIRLSEESDWESINAQLLEIARNNDYGDNFDLTMQPMLEAHLYSTELLFDNYNIGKTDIGQIRNLVLVALFLILIAAFNFMNLSTARSAKRAREIGMRKVLGAQKEQLIAQFLFESIFLVFLAFLFSLFILQIFGNSIGIQVPEGYLSYFLANPGFWLYAVALILILGLLSGIYPAFVLSAYEPIKTLKGNFKSHGSGLWMRRALVSLQFAVSIAVIIGMLVVQAQIDYMNEKDMGFSKENLLSLRLNSREAIQNAESLKNQIEKIDGVLGLSSANALPGTGYGRNGVVPEGYSGDDVWIFSTTAVHHNFAEVMKLEVLEGRFYDDEHPADLQNSVIINEAAAEALGWEEALGKKLQLGPNERTIIGVIKNFHYVGLRYPIEPLLLFPQSRLAGSVAIKIDAQKTAQALDDISMAWTEVNPNIPFEYQFFDDQFNEIFQDDQRFAQVLNSFNWLTIIIACLGLLGLSAYSVDQRTRELGLRKVLGANFTQIFMVLSKEFWYLLLVSNALAIPIAYYYMQAWLSEFVYRIELSFWPFLLALALSFALAWLTIASQAYRALRIDPVKALKYE